MQEKRRSERAEQQRIRSEREKERQKRLEVKPDLRCCNVNDNSWISLLVLFLSGSMSL